MSSIYRINYHLRSHKRDGFIEFIKSLLLTPFVLSASYNKNHDIVDKYCEILLAVEALITEHKLDTTRTSSMLSTLVPTVGMFFTDLPLKDAFLKIDKKRSITSRQLVPPSFNDIRFILNYSQVMAISKQLRLITFDGDMTLYADGDDFAHDSVLVDHLTNLLSHNIYVAIVTAAGYGTENTRYEQRLQGLLSGITNHPTLTSEQKQNFYVMGGECSYLFKFDGKSLQYIDDKTYITPEMSSWANSPEITQLLDLAQSVLNTHLARMGISNRVTVIRKPKAIGIVCNPGDTLSREQLDELVLITQKTLNRSHLKIPFCAFNGGRDVWVDVGNKLIGVRVLQDYLHTKGHDTLHVGDQFLSTGNDIATRSTCATTWITSPEETAELLAELLEDCDE